MAALGGIMFLIASCGKLKEWRMKKAVETWERRISEYRPENGVWHLMAPGVGGFVYPAGIEAQAVDLMLTDVLMAEHILRTQLPLLDTHTTYPLPPVRWKLHRFIRQYRGFRDNDGKLHVHINAVWDDERGDNGWIAIHDGGNFYWQVWVDVDSGRLYDLMINGEA